jgi:hypothetical protein
LIQKITVAAMTMALMKVWAHGWTESSDQALQSMGSPRRSGNGQPYGKGIKILTDN